MTIALVFLSLIMALVVGWLIRKTINKQPWVERQLVDGMPEDDAVAMPPVKVALGTFLAVATSLFSLLVSAYFMRKMAADDWVQLSVPGFLWFNTGVLVLCSVVVQWTRAAAHRGQPESVRMGLAAGGALTLAFLAGQWWVWQLLVADGHYLHANPANAFFYLLTAVHALHLLGGLWVWGSATVMAWRGDDARKVTLRVELCTVYWHYLLLVWLVLFALLLSN